MAGAPFHISPAELMEMELLELLFWESQAIRRLKLENPHE
ncbi:MAG: GpE family phage tail protein [Deltaproteobacteria bacterium]|nr:GpE family phage tail protein [Deltaproteobacteria bacterium]